MAVVGEFALQALALSLIHPYDGFTWFLETLPVLLGMPLVLLTFQRFPLTPLLYRLLFIPCPDSGRRTTPMRGAFGILVAGLFDFSRNHYDRIGHIAQVLSRRFWRVKSCFKAFSLGGGKMAVLCRHLHFVFSL